MLYLDHALLVLRVGVDVGDACLDHFHAVFAELLLLAYRNALVVHDLFGDELADVVVAEHTLFSAGLQDCGLRGLVAARAANFLALDQVQSVIQLVFELGGKLAARTGIEVIRTHQRGGGLQGFLDGRNQRGFDEVLRVAVFLSDFQELLACR